MHESPPPVCVWLKRDLRGRDHGSLAEACARARGGAVFAVFLYVPEVFAQPEWDPSHTEFQRECLGSVEASLGRLGVRLVTRRGEAVAMLARLRRETGFRLLVAHEETGTGVTYARDRRVRRWARESGVEFLEVLDDFLARRGRHYSGGISSPISAPTSCSRLSAYLAFGALSMRTVWQASEARRLEVVAALPRATHPRERADLEAWRRSLQAVQSRLHWHCHFMQKLEDEPAIEFRNMLRAADGLREHGASADRLTAWQAGRTG